MYKSSDSQFFRTTAAIQSWPDAFNISRFVMTFFNYLGSYRNIMQFQISSRRENMLWYIPELSRSEFLEKFSADNSALSDAEDNTSWLLNRGGITDLPLLRRLLTFPKNSPEPSFKNPSVRKKNISKRAGLWESISSTRIGKHGVIQKFFVGSSSTTKCNHNCDQALKKAAGDLYRVHIY